MKANILRASTIVLVLFSSCGFFYKRENAVKLIDTRIDKTIVTIRLEFMGKQDSVTHLYHFIDSVKSENGIKQVLLVSDSGGINQLVNETNSKIYKHTIAGCLFGEENCQFNYERIIYSKRHDSAIQGVLVIYKGMTEKIRIFY